MIEVGIVILNYKTYKDTVRLTKDILAFDMRDRLHIVIVDNLSPNESFSKLKDEFNGNENVSVINSGQNGGFAKGNNVGLRFLKKFNPEFVLILNNDIFFKEEVLIRCIYEYRRLPNVGAISPVQYLPDGKIAPVVKLKCNTFFDDLSRYSIILQKIKHPHKYKTNTQWDNIQKVDIIPGCFIFISYNLFNEIDFFYEGTFLFCEERFLYRKLNNVSRQNYIILDCSYIHAHSLTINSEVSNINQKKLLHEGVIRYTKEFRKHAKIKILALNTMFKIFLINHKIISTVKKLFKHINYHE